MSDDSKVWDHIADLHKKHSELAIQMHERAGGAGPGLEELHAAVTELTAVIRELITAVKEDVKADRAEAKADKGETKSEKTEVKGERPKPGK